MPKPLPQEKLEALLSWVMVMPWGAQFIQWVIDNAPKETGDV